MNPSNEYKPDRPRILIVVEGGVVSRILSDGPCTVLIKDWDNIKDCGAEFDPEGYEPPDFVCNPRDLDLAAREDL